MQDETTPFVQLLGPARIILGGVTHPFVPDKRHQLLAYLALRGEWVGRERLAALFWPDRAPGTARANLRQLLTLVRGLDWAAGLEVEPRRLRWAAGTDLGAFRHAVAGKDWASALARYAFPPKARAVVHGSTRRSSPDDPTNRIPAAALAPRPGPPVPGRRGARPAPRRPHSPPPNGISRPPSSRAAS